MVGFGAPHVHAGLRERGVGGESAGWVRGVMAVCGVGRGLGVVGPELRMYMRG
jgi:hypothetical protein